MKNLLIATVGAVLFTGTAQAATLVDSRDDLQANDSVDWSVLGPTFTPVSNPFSIRSLGGVDLDVSIPSKEFLRIDQTPVFPGAFDVGEALLFTGLGNPGPLTITFDTPVFGAGTQIQSDPLNTPAYTATVEAFDNFDNSLGSFEIAGVSRRDAGSGVLFVGVFDTSGDIKKLVFNTQEEGDIVPFAFNEVSLRTNLEAVPEPESMLGLLVFGTGVAVFKLKGKQKARSTLRYAPPASLPTLTTRNAIALTPTTDTSKTYGDRVQA